MILQTNTNPLYITGPALTRDIDEDLTLVWANFLEAFGPEFNLGSVASADSGRLREIKSEKKKKRKPRESDFMQLGCVTNNLVKFWGLKSVFFFLSGGWGGGRGG